MVVKGKKLTLKEHLQRIKDELRPMTPKQRWEHLWEYYKWVLGVLAIVVFIGAAITTGIINANTEVLASGILVNMEPLEEGYYYLSDFYYETHKSDEGRQAVELALKTYDPSENVEDVEYNYTVLQSIVAQIYAKTLDYVIADEGTMMDLLYPDYFMDLRNLFTEEELAAMDDRVVKLVVEETGEVIPMAINITESEFWQVYGEENKLQYFIMFSITSPRPEVCREMYDRIMVLEDIKTN